MNRFILNETSYHGAGAIKVIPEEIRKRGYKRAFVVSGKQLVDFGVTTKVTDILDGAGIPYALFTDVDDNPTVENVKAGTKALASSDCDCIVAVGGGSSMDTAKAIGIIATNPEYADVVSLEGAVDTKNPSMPIIAVPTTAGTAAEVTINYVITDKSRSRKFVCVDPHDIPVIAVVDPDMMASMPASLAASTGMDALTHAIEGYITKGAWELSDMFHLEAVSLISKNLRAAVAGDPDAREKMALAQYIAGMGFSNVGLGVDHSMAHTLSAYYGMAHGKACAILLPPTLEYNAPASGEKYRDIARAMGVSGTDSMSQEEYRRAAIDAVRSLAHDVGIPENLRGVIKEEDIPALAESAYADACRPGNPRDVSVSDIEKIFRSLL